MRARNYSPCSTFENMRRFWACCWQTGGYPKTSFEPISLQLNDHTDRGAEAAGMARRKTSKHSQHSLL